MSLWANIHKKRQRIKQGSGEKMRKKGDKGAPTPDQLKRAKGEEMEEGKMKQAMMRRQDMAKLASLYSKAMKAMPGSPKQKALKKQIDQYRRELGLNEYGGPPISRKDYLKQKPMNPKLNEGLKDGYIIYKKIGSGINKIKSLGSLKRMPRGKELDRVMDKYPEADGIMAMSKALRNKVQVEAVSPAQQAAIAISKKERGEKPKNECADEKDFKPHMMYDPKTGKGVMAKKYADHVKLDKMGYVHDKPEVKESRAYRDAMRGMSARGATKGMARTKKDRDIEATDDDRKAASKNIIMQLRKAADLPTGANVEFDRGKGKVTRDQAKATLARFNALSKPNEKEKFQKSIKSLADIKKILGR